jgi:hypothetical protein
VACCMLTVSCILCFDVVLAVSAAFCQYTDHVCRCAVCRPPQSALTSADLPITSHPAGSEAAAADALAPHSHGASSHPLLHVGADDSLSSSQHYSSSCNHALPNELLQLADASAPVSLPPPHTVPPGTLDNRELDKLVGTLGRNKATWRRALVLSQWLQDSGHVLDDRLCTTVSASALTNGCGLLAAVAPLRV